MQQTTQSIAADLIVILNDSDGLPVTGLTFADVTAKFMKEGGSSFTAKALTALNFDEIGDGVYNIEFTTTELNTLGSFIYLVDGASVVPYAGVASVVAATVALTSPNISTCTLSGQLVTLEGEPVANAAVQARIVGLPSIFSTPTNSVAFSDKIVSTRSGTDGQFFLSLAQGLSVSISIPVVDYERVLVVPATLSANLFEIP